MKRSTYKVRKASNLQDPLTNLGLDTKAIQDNTASQVTLSEGWGRHLKEETRNWIFSLFKENMINMYEESDWGFDAKAKKTELFSKDSRYIIVARKEEEPFGYVHYMFDLDHGQPILYCYEVQISSDYKNKGFGTILLNLLEEVANRTGMKKVMATVFKNNAASMAFFNKHGYFLDEKYGYCEWRKDYLILSKVL